MKKNLLFINFIFCCFNSFSQNLVPNPDFEIYGNVPCGWTSSSLAAATDSWTSPTQATPDIFSTLISSSCSNYQPNSTDPYCNGHQAPHSGNIFAGFYTQVGSTWREYLQVQLTQPMIIGQEYKVSLYISLSDNSQFATNNIGVGFATVATNSNITNDLAYTPQINFTDVISDTSEWVYLSDTIVPTSAWQYIIIGNFFSDALTDIVNFNPSGVGDRSYYYADDVSVEEVSLGPSTLFTAADTSVCEKFCVDFFDSSSGSPTSWQWLFPGGNPEVSTEQNPTSICYDEPGTYDVTLITSNANGNDTLTLEDYISVSPTPAIPTITQNGYTLTSSAADSYQWQLNTVDIPGATNQSYEVLQTGFYTVIVRDENECANSATIYIQITGIDEINDSNIFIYPNPSNGAFFVKWSNNEMPGAVSVSLVNALGQEVFSSKENISSPDWIKEFNLSDETPAIYFLKIKSNNIFARKKIVLTK